MWEVDGISRRGGSWLAAPPLRVAGCGRCYLGAGTDITRPTCGLLMSQLHPEIGIAP